MSGKVVEFGQDADFYKRRAAGLKDERPEDAMKFLYKALAINPGDGDAMTDAAALALAADRPRLAARLSAQAIASPSACYILGRALGRMRFDAPALTALAACVRETHSEELREAAMRAIYGLRRRETSTDRRSARAARLRDTMRARLINGKYDPASRAGWEGLEKYPEDGFETGLVRALWGRGRLSMAAHMADFSRLPVPVIGRRAGKDDNPGPDLAGLRMAMLRGDYEKAAGAPPLPGAERTYLRAAAAARLGWDRDAYLPLLLDMQAMDPEDPAVEWALRLIREGRDREMPRLYGVCREAAADMRLSILSGEADRCAIRWGLRQRELCLRAAGAAAQTCGGEWLLRDSLADPFTPASCRMITGAALLAMGEKPPFVGLTARRLWVGDVREPESARMPGSGFKVLRMALEVSPQEMAPALLQAWGAFVECGAARRAARDPDGWAAAVALAARQIDGGHRTVQVTESRRALARSRALCRRTTKEKRS